MKVKVHGTNRVPYHGLLLDGFCFTISSDSIVFFELNTLKCKPADDSKALVVMQEVGNFFRSSS
jgi:hypothetical protein